MWPRCCCLWGIAALAVLGMHCAIGAPHTPPNDADVIADLPAGVHHVSESAQALTATRLDVALPLAQLDISRARSTGDMRFLGYAEAILAPWLKQPTIAPQVLLLNATILQSRHAFEPALAQLDRALLVHPNDPQAWLIRATILRVLGRYDEALSSCQHLTLEAEPAVTSLCVQSLRGLMGHLPEAYAAILSLSQEALPPQARAWRFSELGEMAERLGEDEVAERWFLSGLQIAPEDVYMRTAYADLLLRRERLLEALKLSSGFESMEPMLLRAAIAHRELHDAAGSAANAQISTLFAVERQRGDAVHRRELARFLLDIGDNPDAALRAAQENWQVQREPDDLLILLRAAKVAHQLAASAGAREFLHKTGLEDARLAPY